MIYLPLSKKNPVKIDAILCKQVSERLFKNVKRIVIIPHVNPDGDAVGSSLGLGRALQNAGFDTTVIFPNAFPETFRWLCKGIKSMVYEENQSVAEQAISQCDILFFLDFNDMKRLGKLHRYIDSIYKPLVLIDHHPDSTIKAEYQFSETYFSSTSELVTAFLLESGLDGHLDKMGANALLTGIIADTGSFNHNASRPELYETVARLISKGADKEKVNETIFNNFTEKRMRLLGYCLSEKMEVFPEMRSAVIWLSKDELERYNFQVGDTEGFVNYPLSIKGVVFTAFFIEKDDLVKASFRSKGNFPANEFSAVHFDGGGHRNAAGGESKLPLAEVVKKFKALLPDYAELLKNEPLD